MVQNKDLVRPPSHSVSRKRTKERRRGRGERAAGSETGTGQEAALTGTADRPYRILTAPVPRHALVWPLAFPHVICLQHREAA